LVKHISVDVGMQNHSFVVLIFHAI